MSSNDSEKAAGNNTSEQWGRRQMFLIKLVATAALLLLLTATAYISECNKNATLNAEKVAQTKDDGEIVEIDGLKWKRVTFFDECDRCWKIYTSSDHSAGDTHGQKAFALPCPAKGKYFRKKP